MYKNILADLKAIKGNPFVGFISNRGFHALLVYRISNFMWKKKIPFIPLFLTRIIQILYSIDIDYRARIEGGVIIIHGIGLVIGRSAVIKKGCILYHGVTFGIAHKKIDGFPTLEENVLVGAGSTLLGKIYIGANTKIGANTVVVKDVPANVTVVGNPMRIIEANDKQVN